MGRSPICSTASIMTTVGCESCDFRNKRHLSACAKLCQALGNRLLDLGFWLSRASDDELLQLKDSRPHVAVRLTCTNLRLSPVLCCLSESLVELHSSYTSLLDAGDFASCDAVLHNLRSTSLILRNSSDEDFLEVFLERVGSKLGELTLELGPYYDFETLEASRARYLSSMARQTGKLLRLQVRAYDSARQRLGRFNSHQKHINFTCAWRYNDQTRVARRVHIDVFQTYPQNTRRHIQVAFIQSPESGRRTSTFASSSSARSSQGSTILTIGNEFLSGVYFSSPLVASISTDMRVMPSSTHELTAARACAQTSLIDPGIEYRTCAFTVDSGIARWYHWQRQSRSIFQTTYHSSIIRS